MNGSSSRASSWLNWAQQPREAGGLGLAPHQAAGIVGNLVHESGQDLNPWGPTGDNGTAWGTAQWRGDRLARLKQLPNYQTVEGQQAFMRQELDGPENKAYAALQSAKTPEEAAHAWDALYERSDGSTRGQRMASARSLMDQFGGAAPASDAAPGALTTAFAPTEKTPMPALSADSTLGPGALAADPQKTGLFGLPTISDNSYDALMGMASSLAGISDPDHAKALIAQQAANKKVAGDTGSWSIHTFPNGQSVLLNSKGQMKPLQGNYAAPEKNVYQDEADKLAAKADAERYGDVTTAMATADQNLSKIQRMRKATLDPNVTFGGAGDISAAAKNWLYSMGGNPDGLTSTQLVEQAAKENQLGHAKALGANPTNYEDKIISASQGLGLDRTREVNLANQDALEAVYNHQKALAQEAVKYKKANGKLDDGWLEHQAQWEKEHPLDTSPRTRFEAAGGTAAPALPKGVTSIKVLPK
jgi:hypothetical protein